MKRFAQFPVQRLARHSSATAGPALDCSSRGEPALNHSAVRKTSGEINLIKLTLDATQSAFTLVEMLTVIVIIGIIAALSVPVLKNFGKSNISVSASRQLLDDVGRARQYAMTQRTTVYMVFVPTNFWMVAGQGIPGNAWWGGLTVTQWVDATNLLDKQLTGYTFMAHGAVGDQPGNHQWHYLGPWESLPDGSFIPLWKFYNSSNLVAPYTFTFTDPFNANDYFNIVPFSQTNTFPFPTQDSTNTTAPQLPYIAFNYLGQLSDYSGNLLTSAALTEGQDYDQDFVGGGVDIPLAQGSIAPYRDQNTHALLMMASSSLAGSPQVVEMPPGNSTSGTYNVVHIDALTGRATLEYHKMQ
jgi:prepilin-type N-terminal cleavage/methylation domain-containing protein